MPAPARGLLHFSDRGCDRGLGDVLAGSRARFSGGLISMQVPCLDDVAMVSAGCMPPSSGFLLCSMYSAMWMFRLVSSVASLRVMLS